VTTVFVTGGGAFVGTAFVRAAAAGWALGAEPLDGDVLDAQRAASA
jgi:hypothetical protein